ncbi:MAG: type ISP restriction/modification enzyme [bacterium]
MLNIKPNHRAITDYYKALDVFARQGITHETAVKNAFQSVLTYCCKQMNLDFIEEYPYKRLEKYKARIDGAFLDSFRVPQGYWEAKDSQDDLAKEVIKKFEIGYPRDNIIFQSPERAIIYQGSSLVLDEDITSPTRLTSVLKELFLYKTDIQFDWEQAVEEFKMRIPESAEVIIKLIEEERKSNKQFIDSLETFTTLCRTSINPNISLEAIEEMLVQHLLTERIFRKVFENSDFVNRNIIAHEIDKVITSLTSRKFNRNDFLKPLDRFYSVLEKRAQNITDFSIKQSFLNTVYEKFFQGFAVKEADTMGIVYTPQPIVNFMVDSVEEILKREFGLSISAPNVHFLDPFTGTGNFIINLMRKTNKTDLKHKYMNELHCNEIMLLPYYIASMNIEHEFYEITGEYIPFQGICLVDTFQLAEEAQFSMFSEANTERVEKLKQTPIFVFIGNPPYNAGQVNENDNNKNRKYPIIDKRVSDTFAKDSKATNKNMLQDPYIKAFRFAMDKVIERGEGIVAFVSNNSFIDGIALDGVRKHIYENFDSIYVVDLKGNIRKDSMRDGIPLGEKHTVFGLGAMVGISIIFLVKKKKTKNKLVKYSEVDFRSTREEKFKFLEKAGNIYNLPKKEITPDAKNNWLNEGMDNDFDSLLPMGTKEAKAGNENAIFKLYSRGVVTCRDTWAFNFNNHELNQYINKTINYYNEIFTKKINNVEILNEEFYNDLQISWSESLINFLARKIKIQFNNENIRESLYRPYIKTNLYFDKHLTERRYQFSKIFPIKDSELENQVICVSGLGSSKPFHSLMVNLIPELSIVSTSQCFPFYTYNEDGTGRKENISDWALEQFREHYKDQSITKWDIFYYIYAVLHTPAYKEKYSANLRRSLPHIPFYDDFRKYAEAGKKLAELHVNYENQPEYYLQKIEAGGKKLDWRVEKMKLSKDKQTLIYNNFLSMTGIPYEAYEYKLGNRSALEWIIDQYQIKTDKRSGIVNDPNRADEPDYIVRLIGKIITISLETVKIVNEL